MLVDCSSKFCVIVTLTYNHPLLLAALDLGNDTFYLSLFPRGLWCCPHMTLLFTQPLLCVLGVPLLHHPQMLYKAGVSSDTKYLVFKCELPGPSTPAF